MDTSSRNADGAVTRDRILKTALTIFQKYGYTGGSMSRLASALRISAPALYWHFGSKQEIYYEAMRMLLNDFSSYVQSHIRPADPATELRDLVVAHVSWQLKEQDLAGAFAHGASIVSNSDFLDPDQRADLVGIQREYIALVERILQRGKDAGAFDVDDVRLTAIAVITMLEGVQSWYNPTKGLGPDAIATAYATLALNIVRYTGRP